MSWQQLVIESSRDQAILICDLMSEFGAQSVSLQDKQDDPLFDLLDGALPLWPQTTVSGLWPETTKLEAIIDKLAAAMAPLRLPHWRVQTLVDQQWERVWLDRYQPININDRLWICPVGKQSPGQSLPTVYLDPGLAFGTGTHATTQLCLQWLTEHDLTHHRLIDYGCGSGILAIAALKLGAGNATGVDIDAKAVAVSRDNAEINDVASRFNACLPANLDPDLQADFVVANILAEPLMALAPVLEKMVARGGQLALSGLLESQVDQVRDCYRGAFDLEPGIKDGWAILAGQRKS